MIKRLRVRFIALAMASLASVLLVILGAANVLNYRDIVATADQTLALLAENGGQFPAEMRREELRPNEAPAGDFRPPEKPKGDLHRRGEFSPELAFESRFFSVLFDDSGAVVSSDVGMIAAVDEDGAEALAQEVYAAGKANGFTSFYRYLRSAENGQTRIIFLDCGRGLETFRSFLLSTVWIAMLGMAAVFALLVIFSGRIIRPVSESYEKQKQFITDAGHEIKTPLTIIDADAELLEMELGESEWIRDIQSQTKRLTDLTNELISLARMEEDGSRFEMIDFPFSDLVEETSQSFQSRARLENKRFTVSVEPMLSMNGDQKAIRQLLSILLDNALKYSPEGGDISLSADRRSGSLTLTVRNTTAEPMTKEQLSRMFDRFYRADPSRSAKSGGYGIGLSIAKAVVTAHKGKLTAAGEPGGVAITAVFPQ